MLPAQNANICAKLRKAGDQWSAMRGGGGGGGTKSCASPYQGAASGALSLSLSLCGVPAV